MKKNFICYILVSLVLIIGISCKKSYDNYPLPSETLTGVVIDSTTGQPLQTEVGSGGVRIRLDELSWSDNPTPFYFYVEQNGSFNNTKVFKGKYRISADGPFVPLIQFDNSGNKILDKSATTNIEGVTKVDFTVQPMLKVEWASDPIVNTDSTVSVNVKFSRGTRDSSYQNDVTDLFLFVNSLPYIGNNNYDNRYSQHVNYSGADGNNLLGQTITLTTNGGALPGKRDYYIRVGARTNYGLKQYNYTDVKKVTLP